MVGATSSRAFSAENSFTYYNLHGRKLLLVYNSERRGNQQILLSQRWRALFLWRQAFRQCSPLSHHCLSGGTWDSFLSIKQKSQFWALLIQPCPSHSLDHKVCCELSVLRSRSAAVLALLPTATPFASTWAPSRDHKNKAASLEMLEIRIFELNSGVERR